MTPVEAPTRPSKSDRAIRSGPGALFPDTMASYGSNPFAPAPALDSDVPADARVFSRTHIGIATFLGTALAGGIVMALNAHRVGRAVPLQHLAVSALVTAATVVVAILVPYGLIAPLLASVAMRKYAELVECRQLDLLRERGQVEGVLQPAAIGLGLGALAVGVVALIG